MGETNIDSAEMSDLTNAMSDFSVPPVSTDAGGDQKEFTWQMTDWEINFGYYKQIPGLKTAIDTKSIWTIGAGIEVDEATDLLLGTITGHGKDTFNSILKNQHKTMNIAGDSFAEIIRDDEENLVNLKPLDPSSIVIVFNRQGIIIRYEQVNKISRFMRFVKTVWGKKVNNVFAPEQIFHLSRDRVADEVHGISVIPAVKWTVDAIQEAKKDWRRVLHRNIDPLWIFHLETDDVNEINEIKRKNDSARAKGENMYVPKGVVVPELAAVSNNASLNPLPTINHYNDTFFQEVGVPQIVIGNAKEFTDASGKIVYLAFEQTIKAEQLFVEENVLLQLNLEINLVFPASMQNEAISDQPNPDEMTVEEEPVEQAVQGNDVTTELEGKK